MGCGPGLLVHDLAVEVGPKGHVVGVDTSLPMLRLAERRCADLRQVELVEGAAANLAADDATFDAVACIQVLLYIADVDDVLEELHRVLKSGGRYCSSEYLQGPNGDPYYPLPWATHATTSFLVTPEALRGLLEDAGFRNIKSEDLNKTNQAFFCRGEGTRSRRPAPLRRKSTGV